jgi:hypothetical protein
MCSMRHLCQRPEFEFRFDDRFDLISYKRLNALLNRLTTTSMLDCHFSFICMVRATHLFSVGCVQRDLSVGAALAVPLQQSVIIAA